MGARINRLGKGTSLLVSYKNCFWVAQRFSAAIDAYPLTRALAPAVPGRKIFSAIFLVITVLSLLGADSSPARVNDLGHRMMCVCGCNQILLECNHVGCSYSDRMRDELVAAVDRGDNDDLTLQWFVQKYGTAVIAAPTNKGFNRVAWIIPYLVLVLGIVLTAGIVRAWKSKPLLAHAGVVRPAQGPDLDHFREQIRRETNL
jgi:cytochrome c-type biogenesis protein CcmH